MASTQLLSPSPSPVAAQTTRLKASTTGTTCRGAPQCNISTIRVPLITGGLRLARKVQVMSQTTTKRSSSPSNCFKPTIITCSIAQPETLEAVQSTIAKQLSIDECTVTPQTKFADLGADSLDTVEIMMALEEKFGVSIGEGGAENVSTVQDAADLIEKVKAAESA